MENDVLNETIPYGETVDPVVSNTSNPKFWKPEERKALLSLRLSMENEFISNKAHSTLWKRLCRDLKQKGVECTAEQCLNKFKFMK
ncbi:hypothetical protein GJAV_G00057390 [Gymnothorax javanicus]|nr:hypothetical protein GJAV_G00057390 [Gymnothorax javanicus]